MFKFNEYSFIHKIAYEIKDTQGERVWNYILTNQNKDGKYVVNQSLQDLIRLYLTKIAEKALADNFNILDYRLNNIWCNTYSFVSNDGCNISFLVDSRKAIPMNNENYVFKTCQEALTKSNNGGKQ